MHKHMKNSNVGWTRRAKHMKRMPKLLRRVFQTRLKISAVATRMTEDVTKLDKGNVTGWVHDTSRNRTRGPPLGGHKLYLWATVNTILERK